MQYDKNMLSIGPVFGMPVLSFSKTVYLQINISTNAKITTELVLLVSEGGYSLE